jgi:hypothetical protein
MAKDSSPFHQTEFQDIEHDYVKPGILFGLKKPDGTILVNFDHNTSYATLKQIAKITACEIVNVHGTWTFTPTRDTVITDAPADEDTVPEV